MRRRPTECAPTIAGGRHVAGSKICCSWVVDNILVKIAPMLHNKDRATTMDALDAHVQSFARVRRGGSATKSRLSTLRAMEKLGLLGTIVKKFHRLHVEVTEGLEKKQ